MVFQNIRPTRRYYWLQKAILSNKHYFDSCFSVSQNYKNDDGFQKAKERWQPVVRTQQTAAKEMRNSNRKKKDQRKRKKSQKCICLRMLSHKQILNFPIDKVL